MLTAARLRELLHYDQKTGVFTRNVRAGRCHAGQRAGSACNGYRAICIDNVLYYEHRLAWLYVHGNWPEGELDHADTVRSHNWLSNLRPSTSTQNKANIGLRKDNTSGAKGVFVTAHGRFSVKIQKSGRQHRLGTYSTLEKASAIYAAAAKRHFGDYARLA